MERRSIIKALNVGATLGSFLLIAVLVLLAHGGASTPSLITVDERAPSDADADVIDGVVATDTEAEVLALSTEREPSGADEAELSERFEPAPFELAPFPTLTPTSTPAPTATPVLRAPPVRRVAEAPATPAPPQRKARRRPPPAEPDPPPVVATVEPDPTPVVATVEPAPTPEPDPPPVVSAPDPAAEPTPDEEVEDEREQRRRDRQQEREQRRRDREERRDREAAGEEPGVDGEPTGDEVEDDD